MTKLVVKQNSQKRLSGSIDNKSHKTTCRFDFSVGYVFALDQFDTFTFFLTHMPLIIGCCCLGNHSWVRLAALFKEKILVGDTEPYLKIGSASVTGLPHGNLT